MKGLRIIPSAVLICMACGNEAPCVVAFIVTSVRDGRLVMNSGAQRTVKMCQACVKTLAKEFES